MKKIIIIAAAVITSGSVALGNGAIDVNNQSFELYADGSQITCRAEIGTSPDTDTLGWSSGGLALSSGLASVDVNCGPGMCADDCRDWYVFADGNTACYIDNGVWIYQLIDHNIVAGYRYDLYFDGMVRYGGGNDTIRAHFYYLQDPCMPPDVNHIDIVVKDIKVMGNERPNGKDDWTYDLKLTFVAESGAAYIDELLGVKFTSPWIGDLVWVDNVRLKWEWATQAYYPNPEDGELYAPNDVNLIWSPGLWAKDINGHDVYFGSTWGEVNSAYTATSEYKGNQDTNDYNPGSLILGETYYWRIDEVNENYTKPPGPVEPPPNGIWKGEIWSFEVEGKARDPDPADGDDDVAKNVILHWRRGAQATYHDVYFGSTSAEVTTATTASSGTYKGRQNLSDDDYDAGALGLTVGEDYFWRIDEVNYMTVKGDIWNFTIADYILVDDFDYYANPTKLRLVWDDSTGAEPGNGFVFVNGDANYVPADGNSMGLMYFNDSNPYYSQTTRTYGTPQDWTYAGNHVTELEIDWMGDPCNGEDPPIYVKLSDGTNTAQVNPDGNNATEQWTHTWHIALKDFNDGGVNLANITKITLGIGNSKGEAQHDEEGTLYFDDIRLYPPRCYPEYGPAADFTDDCRVDTDDLLFVARDWCKSGGWYDASMPAYTPVVEYLFEEGSGTLVANTGSLGSSHDLIIGKGVDANHDVLYDDPNNDPCWVNDSDPCRGWTLWFDGRDGSYANWHDYDPLTGGGGDYLLGMTPMNLNSNTVTIATWLKPDPWLMDEKTLRYEQSGAFTGLLHWREQDGALTDTGGLTYNTLGPYPYNGELGYTWNGKQATWQFHPDFLIPDWRWSLAAVVIQPDAGILYLADFNDPCDANDDVLYSNTHVYTQEVDEVDGIYVIAADGGIIEGGWVDRFFRGQLDAVRVYDVSLTPFEIFGLAEMEGTEYLPLDSEADLCVGRKDPCDPCSPVNDQIDLCDFSKFADEWLETKLWPEP